MARQGYHNDHYPEYMDVPSLFILREVLALLMLYVRTDTQIKNSNVVRRMGTVCGSLSVRSTARRQAVPRTH